MKEMFKGKVNSPITYLKEAVTQEGNILYLASNSILPDELPNLLVIGEDENAETVKVLNTRADGGLDVERGFQGISKAWPKTTQVARNITEYDIRALQDNVKELNENKVEKVEGKKLSSEDYTAEEKEEVKKIKEKIDIAKLNNNFEDILEIVDEETLKSFVPTINVIKTLFENIPQPVLASLTEDGLMSKEMFDNLRNFDGVKALLQKSLNDIIGTGIYTCLNVRDNPTFCKNHGTLISISKLTLDKELSNTTHLYVDNEGKIAIRTYLDENWGDWKEIGGTSELETVILYNSESSYVTAFKLGNIGGVAVANFKPEEYIFPSRWIPTGFRPLQLNNTYPGFVSYVVNDTTGVPQGKLSVYGDGSGAIKGLNGWSHGLSMVVTYPIIGEQVTLI